MLVRHTNQVDHKSAANVLLQQQHFKATSDNAREGVMIPIKQMQTAYWLSQEEMPPIKFTSLCELQVRNCKTIVAIKIFEFY